MFSEADKNDDGKIDFDEFVAMMLPAAAAVSP
jgi:Ca2+-binding EF-hand superfamily protein